MHDGDEGGVGHFVEKGMKMRGVDEAFAIGGEVGDGDAAGGEDWQVLRTASCSMTVEMRF